MIRVPARPSRLKLISIPSARRNVCARRSRPASARGFFGHPALAEGMLKEGDEYDLAYMGYMIPRRTTVRHQCTVEGLRLSPTSGWGAERHHILSRSRAYFHVHQHENAPGIPLSSLLPGSRPGCTVNLPLQVELIVTLFADIPFPGHGGRARFDLSVPGESWLLGMTLGAQWMDLMQQFATSNALHCTIAATTPSLGMCTVQNVTGQPRGVVVTHVAHVLRFEYQ